MDAAAEAFFRKRAVAGNQVAAARGGDSNYGRRLYGVLRSAGLVQVAAEGRLAVAQGGSAESRHWRLTCEQMREALLAAGAVSEEELDRYAALLENPEVSYLLPLTIAAWGQRAAEGVGAAVGEG
jgi:hypothetical protein